MNILRIWLTQLNSETVTILSFASLTVFSLILLLWYNNRKKYQQLLHNIPAGVVKNYLDSVIQNSQSLQSHLFRGDMSGVSVGVPSVMPISHLAPSPSISAGPGEDLSQKNAEIAELRGRVKDKDGSIKDLENKIAELKNHINTASSGAPDPAALEENKLLKEQNIELKNRLMELEANMNKAAAAPDNNAQLQALALERDGLKERLQEYEIIEDDLANLKKLQQENVQLKRSLEELRAGAADSVDPVGTQAEAPAEPEGVDNNVEDNNPALDALSDALGDFGGKKGNKPVGTSGPKINFEDVLGPTPVAPAEPAAPAAVAEPAPVAPPPESLASSPAEVTAAATAAAPAPAPAETAPPAEAKDAGKDAKSAEDLLSEFEKMLG